MMLHLKCGQAPCTFSAIVGPASQTELSASDALALCVLWPRGSTDSWRSHHDAVTHAIYGDTIRAGIEGRTEVRGLFSSLLPPANARRHREERDGLVPDALLRRPTELDAVHKDHLHDVKIIHMAPST